MDAEKIFNALNQIKISIDQHKDEIEKLDQEIGDGDHIFNIQRGINESLDLKDELSGQAPNEVLKKIGIKIMTTVGGSSGALFATLIMGMSKKYSSELTNQKNIASMFTEGVNAMKKRGKADLGEKTMLDVLIPVSIELEKLSDQKDVKLVAGNIKEVAEKGMLSTKNLIATKGRASFLGQRSKGHIDPGARSSQLAIEAICNTIINA
ncbi:MAG: dihydroxyacetone kinase subunit L [Chloroflexi bacterium]|jgi:dihydroxyacetone kinase-like protein|nr:dihydroxyacetone kinase subunit L [Chloroflexota bacterium]|tara:strand:+ start:1018 stop:1641 length:624 start_codon:yes stop_codon:yes gene_type:complete